MEKDYEVVIKHLEDIKEKNSEFYETIELSQEVVEQTNVVIRYTAEEEPILITRSK